MRFLVISLVIGIRRMSLSRAASSAIIERRFESAVVSSCWSHDTAVTKDCDLRIILA